MQWSSEFYLAPLCYRCVDLPRLGHNLFSAVSMRIRQIALATSHWACCQISRMPGGQFAPPPPLSTALRVIESCLLTLELVCKEFVTQSSIDWVKMRRQLLVTLNAFQGRKHRHTPACLAELDDQHLLAICRQRLQFFIENHQTFFPLLFLRTKSAWEQG